MPIQWRDDAAYIEWLDDRTYEVHPGTRNRQVEPPALPVPSGVVAYVNGLADEFDGWALHDSPDNAELAIIAAVGVIGTGLVIALGAFCIVGAVTVARWLGWA